jgi:hypothetical protein
MIYFFREQKKLGLFNLAKESRRLGAAVLVFLVSLAASHLLLVLIPAGWLHLGLKRH